MDVSDGLILDLERMMNRQKLNYKIHIDKVPISKKLNNLIKQNKFKKENFISNGDDYQILFTSSPKNLNKIKKLASRIKIKITPIGKIIKEANLILNSNNENLIKSMKIKGYLHTFR